MFIAPIFGAVITIVGLGCLLRAHRMGEPKAKLLLSYQPKPPYTLLDYHETMHRIGIQNLSSNISAKNVRVSLLWISPFPLDENFRAQLPCSLYLANDAESCSINPNEIGFFTFARLQPPDNNGLIPIEGIDQNKPSEHWPITMKPGETWFLKVAVSCANASPREAVLCFDYSSKASLSVKLAWASPN